MDLLSYIQCAYGIVFLVALFLGSLSDLSVILCIGIVLVGMRTNKDPVFFFGIASSFIAFQMWVDMRARRTGALP